MHTDKINQIKEMEILSVVLINLLVLILIPTFIYAIFKSKKKRETNKIDEIKISKNPEIPNNLTTNPQTDSITIDKKTLSKINISRFKSIMSNTSNSKFKKKLSYNQSKSLRENHYYKGRVAIIKENRLDLNKFKSATDF